MSAVYLNHLKKAKPVLTGNLSSIEVKYLIFSVKYAKIDEVVPSKAGTKKFMTVFADNKKAYFDYEILDKYPAGIVLSGQEVKSVRSGQISLKGAFVTFHGTDALLTNAHITPYSFAGSLPDYDPTRSRKLLLKKREINYLRGKSEESGLTIVPLRVYSNNHLIKVEIAVARGKHLYDKRETVKKRELNREIKKTLKGV